MDGSSTAVVSCPPIRASFLTESYYICPFVRESQKTKINSTTHHANRLYHNQIHPKMHFAAAFRVRACLPFLRTGGAMCWPFWPALFRMRGEVDGQHSIGQLSAKANDPFPPILRSGCHQKHITMETATTENRLGPERQPTWTYEHRCATAHHVAFRCSWAFGARTHDDKRAMPRSS